MQVSVHHTGGDVVVAWQPPGAMPDCRGFALLRRRNGIEEMLRSWVGFEVQKYQWIDYMTSPEDRLQYRVLPLRGLDDDNLRPDAQQASAWTEDITLPRRRRGVEAMQTVSHRLSAGARNLRNKALWLAINIAAEPVTG